MQIKSDDLPHVVISDNMTIDCKTMSEYNSETTNKLPFHEKFKALHDKSLEKAISYAFMYAHADNTFTLSIGGDSVLMRWDDPVKAIDKAIEIMNELEAG